MAYEKFNILKSTAVPLPIENIDTDQIIPARFLKATERVGFADNLFRDWRYDSDDNLNENFVLNNSIYSGKILLAGKNFGSGSSREHAAWAIYDYGFRCVISSFFADIFKNNCLNIGVLPLRVKQEDLDYILELVFENPSIEITVDLLNQKLLIDEKEFERYFEINSHKKNNLMNGLDDIDYLANIRDEIIDFSKKIPF
jgi:3-isopropylmalate/(R)-2-methylmalate dehydratase small subunit